MRIVDKLIFSFLFFIFIFIFSQDIYAQEAIKEKLSNSYVNPIVSYHQIIFAVVFICIFILAAIFITKKFRFNVANSQGLIEVIYTHPLSSKDKLIIVKAAHEYILLSLSNSGIRKLHTLDKSILEKLASEESYKTHEFANIFANILRKDRNA